MNANELADAMETRASIRRQATSRKSVQENANDRLADQLEQAATMLRQQQAEIKALKQIIDANNLNQNIGQFVKPTNEPVAWMYEKPNGASKLSFVKEKMLWEDMTETPLYTHPVKELTEKEKWLTEIDAKQQALKKIIDWLILEHDTLACTGYPLRKASEK